MEREIEEGKKIIMMEENLGEIEKVIREKEKEEIKEIKRRLGKKIIIVKNDMEEEI